LYRTGTPAKSHAKHSAAATPVRPHKILAICRWLSVVDTFELWPRTPWRLCLGSRLCKASRPGTPRRARLPPTLRRTAVAGGHTPAGVKGGCQHHHRRYHGHGRRRQRHRHRDL